jgi:hypothetical protein
MQEQTVAATTACLSLGFFISMSLLPCFLYRQTTIRVSVIHSYIAQMLAAAAAAAAAATAAAAAAIRANLRFLFVERLCPRVISIVSRSSCLTTGNWTAPY